MKEVKSNIILKSESNSINIVSTILEEIREHYKIANEVFDDIYITVSEAINNAIYHGNKCDYSKKVYFNYNLKVNSSI